MCCSVDIRIQIRNHRYVSVRCSPGHMAWITHPTVVLLVKTAARLADK